MNNKPKSSVIKIKSNQVSARNRSGRCLERIILSSVTPIPPKRDKRSGKHDDIDWLPTRDVNNPLPTYFVHKRQIHVVNPRRNELFSCIGTINKVNSLSHSSKIQWWLIVFGVMKDLTNSGWLLMHDKPMHYLQNHPSNYQHWTTSVCCQSRSVQFLSSYQIPPQWHHYQQAVCRWCGCTRWQYGWTYEVLRVRKVWRRECGRDRQLL